MYRMQTSFQTTNERKLIEGESNSDITVAVAMV